MLTIIKVNLKIKTCKIWFLNIKFTFSMLMLLYWLIFSYKHCLFIPKPALNKNEAITNSSVRESKCTFSNLLVHCLKLIFYTIKHKYILNDQFCELIIFNLFTLWNVLWKIWHWLISCILMTVVNILVIIPMKKFDMFTKSYL